MNRDVVITGIFTMQRVAAADSWFSHLAIEVDGEETSNEWLEPVSEEEYSKFAGWKPEFEK